MIIYEDSTQGTFKKYKEKQHKLTLQQVQNLRSTYYIVEM